MIARIILIPLCAGSLLACDKSGPYLAKISAKSPTMEHCKERIVDLGNAIPIMIDEITSDTSDLFSGVYENGKTFECRAVENENGEIFYSAIYYETKWRD